RRQFTSQVYRRALRTQMKADGTGGEEAITRRRQNMLASVLLHVIEPPCPIDDAVNDIPGPTSLFIDDVHHIAGFIVVDLNHSRVAERAGVERLTAGCRIETGAVQAYRCSPSLLIDANDG